MMKGPVSSDVFVTILEAPPGAPWDQGRAAKVAAELEAPMPVGELDIAMQRLGPWRSKEPARFAIGYRRAGSGVMEDRARVLVDGREIVLTFRSAAVEAERRRTFIAAITVAVLTATALSLAAMKWIHVREQRAAALEARAQIARQQLVQQRRQAATLRGLAIIERNDLSGRSGQQIASDLIWLGLARDRSVPISAVRWENRRLEVSATSTPVTEASSSRAGIWIVAPQRQAAGPSIVSRPSTRRGAK